MKSCLFNFLLVLSFLSSIYCDLLSEFYDRLAKSDVKTCKDKFRLLPECTECIPGMEEDKSTGLCSIFSKQSNDIRNEILTITKQRYSNLRADRPFGLYPYLELPEFLVRQQTFGKMLSDKNAQFILDIGAYYNPINLFFNSPSTIFSPDSSSTSSSSISSSTPTYCPQLVVIVEPILDPLSALVPCTPLPSSYSRQLSSTTASTSPSLSLSISSSPNPLWSDPSSGLFINLQSNFLSESPSSTFSSTSSSNSVSITTPITSTSSSSLSPSPFSPSRSTLSSSSPSSSSSLTSDSPSSSVSHLYSPGHSTHYLFLPITFRQFVEFRNNPKISPENTRKLLRLLKDVVCIGCDSHYGPNRKLLETTFDRPYSLFLEYPSEYVHNQPFRKMMGEGEGEELLFLEKFQAKTNETQYKKRVMKVFEYSIV